MFDQNMKVLVCAQSQPPKSAPVALSICNVNESAYLLESTSTMQSAFDPVEAASFFGFGFGIVLFFWLLGLKSSLLLKPFWR